MTWAKPQDIYDKEMVNETDYSNSLSIYPIVTWFDMLEVMYSRTFVWIVRISSLATTCIGQPLLTFRSHHEQNWLFAMIVAAQRYNISCCAALLLPTINLKRMQLMRNVHLVNSFCRIRLHIHVNGLVWHSHSSEFCLCTWLQSTI